MRQETKYYLVGDDEGNSWVENSYEQCSCGSDCMSIDKSEEPCWGEVNAIDEINLGDDWGWVHGCKGHTDYSSYTPFSGPISE